MLPSSVLYNGLWLTFHRKDASATRITFKVPEGGTALYETRELARQAPMLSPQKTDRISRTVSSLTLDGRRLTAEMTLVLTRAIAQGDAEAVAAEVASTIDSILSAFIVQGQAPLTAPQLEAMTNAQSRTQGKVDRIRITSLRLAVPSNSAYSSAPRPPPTAPPARSETSSASVPPASSPRRTPPSGAPSVPSVRARPASTMPSTVSSSVPPARVTSSVPPAKVASSVPPAMASSSVAPPRIVSSVPPAGGDVVRASLRAASTTAVLAVLSSLTRTAVDTLSLLEGAPASRDICREVCACFAASIYHSSLAAGHPHRMAAARVEEACRRAFDGNGPSATEIGFYIGTDSPVTELAGRLATILGAERDVAVIRSALEGYYAPLAATLAPGDSLAT